MKIHVTMLTLVGLIALTFLVSLFMYYHYSF